MFEYLVEIPGTQTSQNYLQKRPQSSHEMRSKRLKEKQLEFERIKRQEIFDKTQ